MRDVQDVPHSLFQNNLLTKQRVVLIIDVFVVLLYLVSIQLHSVLIDLHDGDFSVVIQSLRLASVHIARLGE